MHESNFSNLESIQISDALIDACLQKKKKFAGSKPDLSAESELFLLFNDRLYAHCLDDVITFCYDVESCSWDKDVKFLMQDETLKVVFETIAAKRGITLEDVHDIIVAKLWQAVRDCDVQPILFTND